MAKKDNKPPAPVIGSKPTPEQQADIDATAKHVAEHSGINSVVRGDPAASLPGAALLVEAEHAEHLRLAQETPGHPVHEEIQRGGAAQALLAHQEEIDALGPMPSATSALAAKARTDAQLALALLEAAEHAGADVGEGLVHARQLVEALEVSPGDADASTYAEIAADLNATGRRLLGESITALNAELEPLRAMTGGGKFAVRGLLLRVVPDKLPEGEKDKPRRNRYFLHQLSIDPAKGTFSMEEVPLLKRGAPASWDQAADRWTHSFLTFVTPSEYR